MLQTLPYAFRQLRHSLGFALAAILILALGIGATTAIFTVLDAVLLKPLPFPHPDRLVAIASVPDLVVSIPTVQDWQTRSHSFASIAAKSVSDELLQIVEGSLYPALQRMLKAGWLESEMGLSVRNRPVRIFKETAAGNQHLKQEISSFEKMFAGITRVLAVAQF